MEDAGGSVLVVDDDVLRTKTLREVLRPEFTFYAARNGREAVKAAEKILPDVILLDIPEPEFDGYSVFAELKGSEKARDIPVIFISEHSDAESEKRALRFGASDYITKPFDPVIVKLRVQNQIKIISRIRLLFEKQIEEMERMKNEILTHLNTIIQMTRMFEALDNLNKEDPDEPAVTPASRLR